MRGAFFATVMLVLAGCQLGGAASDGATDIAAPSAIQGPEVEVTTLAPLGEAPKTAPVPDAPPVVEKPKSPGHIACEKRGGSFVSTGKSGAMTCQTATRDGGKQCRRESDCDGLCLARSGTCAPVKPMLGCQAILQDDGRRVELCID